MHHLHVHPNQYYITFSLFFLFSHFYISSVVSIVSLVFIHISQYDIHCTSLINCKVCMYLRTLIIQGQSCMLVLFLANIFRSLDCAAVQALGAGWRRFPGSGGILSLGWERGHVGQDLGQGSTNGPRGIFRGFVCSLDKSASVP